MSKFKFKPIYLEITRDKEGKELAPLNMYAGATMADDLVTNLVKHFEAGYDVFIVTGPNVYAIARVGGANQDENIAGSYAFGFRSLNVGQGIVEVLKSILSKR